MNRSTVQQSSAPLPNGNVPRHQISLSAPSSPGLIGSTPSTPAPPPPGPITATISHLATTTAKPTKAPKIKSHVGQGNGKAPARNNKTQQQQQSGGNRKGGKHDKNKEQDNSGRKKQPVSNAPALSQQYRKHGAAASSNNNQGSTNVKPTFRPKQPKKEVQVFNDLQRKTDKTYKSLQGSEKTVKAPKQVKENASLRLHQVPRTSSTNAPPSAPAPASTQYSEGGDSYPLLLTTSPSTASTASQTRLSKVLFQKYDRIQQVYPEFHPYVPPISEAEKKASLFLAMPNPNSKKQATENGGKVFRENGKIIFFNDPDFFPATTKPQQRPQQQSPAVGGGMATAVKEQQRNGTLSY